MYLLTSTLPLLLLLAATTALAAPSSTIRHPLPKRQSTTNTSTTGTACVSPTPQPTYASALGTPTGTLVGIFNGVGVQNYQCANASSVPTSIGANANLTSIAGATCGTGIHFFDNPTTPEFDLEQLGNNVCAKSASIVSPDTPATDVNWLRLSVTSSSTGDVSQVYRLETKGGQPPASCGEAGVVQVPYGATYWFYQ